MYSARPFRSYTYNFTLLKLLGIKDHKDRPYLFTQTGMIYFSSPARGNDIRGGEMCVCVCIVILKDGTHYHQLFFESFQQVFATVSPM